MEENARLPLKRFNRYVWTAAGILTLVVVFLLLFQTLFSLMLLILAGILIAVYFYGCASLLQRLNLSPKLSIILSVVVNLLLLIGFFWFVGARIGQQVSQLSETLPATISQARTYLDGTTVGGKLLDFLESSGNSQKTINMASSFFSSSFGILSDLYIVILLGLFFTASPGLYKKGIVHLLPPAAKEKGDKLLDELNVVLKKWLKGQIIGFFFIAILSGVGLWILGIPLILTLALIAGLMNLIPNFGPIIALIPAVLLALMQGPTTALIVAGIYTGIQIIQSAVTQPLIQKKMVSIPPALIIIGQVAMGLLGGFWGVLLATPIVAILMTVINKLYINPQEHHRYEVETTA